MECRAAFAELHDNIMKAAKSGETHLVRIKEQQATWDLLRTTFELITKGLMTHHILKEYSFVTGNTLAEAYYVRLSKNPMINGKTINPAMRKAGKDLTIALYSAIMNDPDYDRIMTLCEHIFNFTPQIDKFVIPDEPLIMRREAEVLTCEFNEYITKDFPTAFEKAFFCVSIEKKANDFEDKYGPAGMELLFSCGFSKPITFTAAVNLVLECNEYNTKHFESAAEEENVRVALENKVEEFHAKYGPSGSKLLLSRGFAMNVD